MKNALLFILLINIILIAGCVPANQQTPLKTVSNPSGPTSVAVATNVPALETANKVTPLSMINPIYVHLSLSPVPKLGEVGELTVAVRWIEGNLGYGKPREGLDKSKASLVFNWINIHGSYSEALHYQSVPLDEVLVGGDATWEGNALVKSGIEFKSKIKLTREGIWGIGAVFSGEGWSNPVWGGMRVAVADGTAALMGKPAFKSSPLFYLGNFDYGGRSSVPIEKMLTENRPVIFDMDISKAPRVGEEVALSCIVYSFHDIPDFSAQLTFDRRTKTTLQPEMPGDYYILNGNSSWKGDLKKGALKIFSVVIRFPEEGDWLVRAHGMSSEQREKNDIGYFGGIRFSITEDKSYFGWPEQPDPLGGYKIIR